MGISEFLFSNLYSNVFVVEMLRREDTPSENAVYKDTKKLLTL